MENVRQHNHTSLRLFVFRENNEMYHMENELKSKIAFSLQRSNF